MKEPTKKSKVVVEKPPVKKQKKKSCNSDSNSHKKKTYLDERIERSKKLFLKYYSLLPIQKLAALKIGRNEDIVIIWKKEDAKFNEQVEEAKADWALRTSMTVKSSEWLLERIMNEYFGDKQKEKENNTLDKFMDRISKMIP